MEPGPSGMIDKLDRELSREFPCTGIADCVYGRRDVGAVARLRGARRRPAAGFRRSTNAATAKGITIICNPE